MPEDELPERAKLGNPDRPDRVPPPEHDAPVPVGERAWQANNRRRDTARGMADEQPPTE